MKTMPLLANALGGFLTHYGSKRRHVGFMPWAVDGMLVFDDFGLWTLIFLIVVQGVYLRMQAAIPSGSR